MKIKENGIRLLPNWFQDLVNKIQNRNDFEFDVVYNFYDCGVCVMKHAQDKLKFKYFTITKNGKSKKIHKRTCNCDKHGNFHVKFKICSQCKEHFVGVNLRNGMCDPCKRKNISGVKKTYFQNQQQIQIKSHEYITYWGCVHRSSCLSSIIDSKLFNCALHCGGCPKYEKPEY